MSTSATAKQQHPVRTGVAVVCMLLFLACLGLLAWSANQGAVVNGPVHITADTEHVLITLNEEILALDSNGNLRNRYPLAALGVDGYPIDLRLQDDNSLLIATQQPAGVFTCSLPAGQCRAMQSPLFAGLRSQIKVLPDTDGTGLFVSDTSSGRLHWLSADGSDTHALMAVQPFSRLNDIALDNERRLWVADSGNRRIVILQQEAGGDWAITAELSAASELTRPGLDWPMMITFAADGNAWVTQPDPTAEQADLLLYDAQQGVKARIELPEASYPTDVARSGNTMLITDRVNFRLLGIDSATRAVTPFGDDRVQAILEAAARERAEADRLMDLSQVGMVLFGVLMIVMAIWATPKGRRFTRHSKAPVLEPGAAVETGSGQLHWLVCNEKTERFVRLAKRMLLGTSAVMLGLLVYAWYLLDGVLNEQPLRQAATCITGISEMFAVLTVFAVSVPGLGYLSIRHLNNRLGSDGHSLHIKLHDGRHLTLDPARLVYTGRILAYEQHLLPIQTGNRKPLYADGEIETHIAPLLAGATRLGEFALIRYQFRHREPATMLSIYLVVAFTAALWYTGAWRLLLPGG